VDYSEPRRLLRSGRGYWISSPAVFIQAKERQQAKLALRRHLLLLNAQMFGQSMQHTLSHASSDVYNTTAQTTLINYILKLM